MAFEFTSWAISRNRRHAEIHTKIGIGISDVDVRIAWLCMLTFGNSYQVDKKKRDDNIWLKITKSKQSM